MVYRGHTASHLLDNVKRWSRSKGDQEELKEQEMPIQGTNDQQDKHPDKITINEKKYKYSTNSQIRIGLKL